MKIPKGQRPWSIWVFAASFFCVAVIELLLALRSPETNVLVWQLRPGAFVWTRDSALIASFSMFTIALIPILWIFILAAERARWVVLVFGLFKIWLLVQPRPLHPIRDKLESLLLVGPAFITLALVMLFVPASTRWFSQHRGREIESAR